MLHHQIFQTDNRCINRARGDNPQRIRDLDSKIVLLLILIWHTKQGKRCRCWLGLPLGFNRSQFGFLHVAHLIAGLIAQNNNREHGSHTEAGSNRKGAPGERHIAAAQQVVGANAKDKHCAAGVARCHGVNELHLSNRVQHQFREAHHLHTHGFKVEIRRDRVLHPAVCYEDPQSREVRAQRNQPGHRHMLHFAQAIPAKEEQANKGGLKEERHQAFNGQRGTKDIAYVVRVIGPVSPELELHGQTGGHAQRKVDTKQLAPELGHIFIDLFAGQNVDRFHDCQ